MLDTRGDFFWKIYDSDNDACSISKPVQDKPHAVSWHCIENNCTQVFMNSYDVIEGSTLNVADEPGGVLCYSTCYKDPIRHHLSFGIMPVFRLRSWDQIWVANTFSLILWACYSQPLKVHSCCKMYDWIYERGINTLHQMAVYGREFLIYRLSTLLAQNTVTLLEILSSFPRYLLVRYWYMW